MLTEKVWLATRTHRMSAPIRINDRTFVSCEDCGMVLETYDIPHVKAICPIGDLESEYQERVAEAKRLKDEGIMLWRSVGANNLRDIARPA